MRTSTFNLFAEFPRAELVEALRQWWKTEVVSDENDILAGRTGTIYRVLVQLDSISVMDGLLVAEGVLGVELPVNLVKRGGYSDCEEMISHLVPRIEDAYRGVSF